ncbi:hypothetical protein PQI64_11220 [Shewanella bicestrii]
MDRQIMIIGSIGVGKSMLRRALMELELRQLVTVVDVDEVEPERGEITGAWIDELVSDGKVDESVGKITVKDGLPNEIAALIRRTEFNGCSLIANRNQYKDLRHGLETHKVTGGKRRNKSERKRNRANSWR